MFWLFIDFLLPVIHNARRLLSVYFWYRKHEQIRPGHLQKHIHAVSKKCYAFKTKLVRKLQHVNIKKKKNIQNAKKNIKNATILKKRSKKIQSKKSLPQHTTSTFFSSNSIIYTLHANSSAMIADASRTVIRTSLCEISQGV